MQSFDFLMQAGQHFTLDGIGSISTLAPQSLYVETFLRLRCMQLVLQVIKFGPQKP